jgi:hypothetical protein
MEMVSVMKRCRVLLKIQREQNWLLVEADITEITRCRQGSGTGGTCRMHSRVKKIIQNLLQNTERGESIR